MNISNTARQAFVSLIPNIGLVDTSRVFKSVKKKAESIRCGMIGKAIVIETADTAEIVGIIRESNLDIIPFIDDNGDIDIEPHYYINGSLMKIDDHWYSEAQQRSMFFHVNYDGITDTCTFSYGELHVEDTEEVSSLFTRRLSGDEQDRLDVEIRDEIRAKLRECNDRRRN